MVMESGQSGGSGPINLGIPMRGTKDGYLQNYFQTRQTFAQMLVNVDNVRDPRITLYTDFLISGITDAKDRELLYLMKADYYKKQINELDDDDPSEEQKGVALATACMRVLGDVSSWFDEFLAITHTQTFDVCGYQGESERRDEERYRQKKLAEEQKGNGGKSENDECTTETDFNDFAE